MEKEFVRNLYRHRFGCIPVLEKDVALHTYNQMIDILYELYENMEQKAKNEYNRGYVDCARKYQSNDSEKTDIRKYISEPLIFLRNEILEKIKYCDTHISSDFYQKNKDSQGYIEFLSQKSALLEVLNSLESKINGLNKSH